MSALLPKYGPLPAAMMALTFATAAPPAHAAEPASGLYETAPADTLRSLRQDAPSIQLSAWIDRAQAAFAAAQSANNSVSSLVSLRLSEGRSGLSHLAVWSAHATNTIFGAASNLSHTMAAAAADPALSEAARDGLLVSLASVHEGLRATRMRLEERTMSTGHRLSSFALADFGKAREMRRTLVTQRGAVASTKAATTADGLYQVFGAVLDIEAGVRRATNWTHVLQAAETATRELRQDTTAEAQAWVENMSLVANQLQVLSNDGLEMVGIAKAAFVRIIGDAAKITASALPAPRPNTMNASVDNGQVTQASAVIGAVRTFGRKIDYLGFAHRWVIGAP